MTPTSIPDWAAQNGVPVRTAYHRARQGTLGVPVLSLGGQYRVLDDPAGDGEQMVRNLWADLTDVPLDRLDRASHFSPQLAAWLGSLADRVAGTDLLPLVLRQVEACAAGRANDASEVAWRYLDWLLRVDLPSWYARVPAPDYNWIVSELTAAPAVATWPEFRARFGEDSATDLGVFVGDVVERASRGHTGSGGFAHEVTLEALPEPRGALMLQLPVNDVRLHAVLGAATSVDNFEHIVRNVAGCYGPPLRELLYRPMLAAARVVAETYGWPATAPMPPAAASDVVTAAHTTLRLLAQQQLAPLIVGGYVRELEAIRRVALGQEFGMVLPEMLVVS
jgi:hypothetical protein